MTNPITASVARASLYRLIDQTAESHQPILISGKRSSAVLISAEDWQAIQEGHGRATRQERDGTRLVTWQVVFSEQSLKDAKKLAAAGLKAKAQEPLAVLANDPFQNPPPYDKLVGDLDGAHSRRINIQHRLVYEVFKAERKVRVLRMWTHYE